jgi:hypothetical protein
MISIELLDGLAPTRLGRDLAVLDRAGTIGADIDDEVGIELGEGLTRVLKPVHVPDREGDRILFDVEPGIADLGIAQRVAHGLDDRVQPLMLGRGDIDLEQQVGPAAQVEPERHLLVRDPARQ